MFLVTTELLAAKDVYTACKDVVFSAYVLRMFRAKRPSNRKENRGVQ